MFTMNVKQQHNNNKISAYHLMLVYICTKFHEYILVGIKVIDRNQFSQRKIPKGHNSV